MSTESKHVGTSRQNPTTNLWWRCQSVDGSTVTITRAGVQSRVSYGTWITWETGATSGQEQRTEEGR